MQVLKFPFDYAFGVEGRLSIVKYESLNVKIGEQIAESPHIKLKPPVRNPAE